MGCALSLYYLRGLFPRFEAFQSVGAFPLTQIAKFSQRLSLRSTRIALVDDVGPNDVAEAERASSSTRIISGAVSESCDFPITTRKSPGRQRARRRVRPLRCHALTSSVRYDV